MSIRRQMEVDPPAEGFCRLRSIRLLSSEDSAPTADSSGEDYGLLLVEQGKGSLRLSGISYRVTRGHGLIVVPGTNLEVLADEGSRLQVYVLVFQAYQPVESSSPSPPLPVYMPIRRIFSANGRLALSDCAAVIESAGHLYESRDDCAPLQSYKRFIRFQEIILTCLEAGYALEPEEEEALIDKVKRHIEIHYAEQVSLSELAELASFSKAYFSTWFKKETGQSPIEYLTEYRLLRARELMFSGSSDVTGSLRLKEIARRVGLSDEFYFSRVFKKRTGMAPAFYMKNKPQTIATVIQPYSYHLLALGISPVAGLFDYVPPQFQQGSCPPVNLLRFRKNEWLPQLRALRPDLILTHNMTGGEGQLRPIAPLGIVPWDYNDIYDQLRLTADLIGKQAEAEGWIHAYEAKASRVRRAVSRYFGRTETIAAIRFVQGQLRVYGARNMGHVLYRSLGLTPPDQIRSQLKNATFVWETITAEQLPDYDADRLIVLCDRQSQALFHEVTSGTIWRSLTGVRSGRVIHATSGWADYHPLALERQLQDVLEWASGQ